jgi:hypothetical protein
MQLMRNESSRAEGLVMQSREPAQQLIKFILQLVAIAEMMVTVGAMSLLEIVRQRAATYTRNLPPQCR